MVQQYPVKANHSKKQEENVITQEISANGMQDSITYSQVYNPPMPHFDPVYHTQFQPQFVAEPDHAHQQHQGFNPFLYETKRFTQNQYPTSFMNYHPHRQPVQTR